MRGILATCAALALALPAVATAAVTQGDSPAADRAIALAFRPRLLFDSGERWRPTDVDRFLAEPGHLACPPTGGGACVPFTSVAQLTPAVAYLDLRGTRHDGADATDPELGQPSCQQSLPQLRDCDRDGHSVIYAHVAHLGGRIAIDYWWFLRYNAYFPDDHEGDWEGVTVILDAALKNVLEVHFAAHAGIWRYDDDVPQIVGGRVKVYVARGDHAAYPRPCAHLCRQTDAALPEAHYDGKRSWVGNSAAGCRRQCVQLLPEVDHAPTSWDAWNGRWGVTLAPAFAPPQTPAFQRRYRRPFSATNSSRHHFHLL